MTFLDDYSAYVATHGTPERIEILLSDINGIFRGKWIPGDQPEKLAKGKVKLPYSTCAVSIRGHEVSETGLGIVVGDPDGVLVPISGSLCPVPWATRPTAQVLVDILDPSGEASPLSPRVLLQRILDRYAAHGWRPVVAPELEFYALQARRTVDAPPVPVDRSPPAQNYDMEVMARAAPWLDALETSCTVQSLPTETITAEYGPGQFEVNFAHGDALAAADQAALFRRATRGTLASHGLEATFMAKPYVEDPGNGFHLHASVVGSDGRNIFDQPGQPGPRLSAAVAGVLSSMRDLQAVFAPHLNSYRRFGPNSFAPTAPEWGGDDRSVAVRLVETTGLGARLEHRIAGADANPYLVLAAILGGMLDGIEAEMTPPPAIHDAPPAKPLSPHWSTALDRFEASQCAERLFGAEFVKVFTAVKRREIEELTSTIPPHEYAAYLSRL